MTIYFNGIKIKSIYFRGKKLYPRTNNSQKS